MGHVLSKHKYFTQHAIFIIVVSAFAIYAEQIYNEEATEFIYGIYFYLPVPNAITSDPFCLTLVFCLYSQLELHGNYSHRFCLLFSKAFKTHALKAGLLQEIRYDWHHQFQLNQTRREEFYMKHNKTSIWHSRCCSPRIKEHFAK